MRILCEFDFAGPMPFVCIATALVNQAQQGFCCCAQAREDHVPQVAASLTGGLGRADLYDPGAARPLNGYNVSLTLKQKYGYYT